MTNLHGSLDLFSRQSNLLCSIVMIASRETPGLWLSSPPVLENSITRADVL